MSQQVEWRMKSRSGRWLSVAQWKRTRTVLRGMKNREISGWNLNWILEDEDCYRAFVLRRGTIISRVGRKWRRRLSSCAVKMDNWIVRSTVSAVWRREFAFPWPQHFQRTSQSWTSRWTQTYIPTTVQNLTARHSLIANKAWKLILLFPLLYPKIVLRSLTRRLPRLLFFLPKVAPHIAGKSQNDKIGEAG
jgi:hypothetical protein